MSSMASPDCAVASQSFCRVVRSFLYFRYGVANSEGESSAAHYRNIWKIIIDTSDSRICNALPSKDLFIRRHFHRLFHIDKFHIHSVGPAEESRTLAARDATGA
jgi:hypothetical protein